MELLERTRWVWHWVLVFSGGLEPPQKTDKRNFPKTTKGAHSAFEKAAEKLSMSEASVRRIYYNELKRRILAGGWVPPKRSG